MNIVIVGLGYVGKATAALLRDAGHHVSATTTSRSKLTELQRYVDRTAVLDALPELLERADGVVVAVAPHEGSESGYQECYVGIMERLKKYLPKKNSPHVIYTSSASVYGSPGGCVAEESPLIPSNAQGEILIGAEKMALSLPTKVTIFRLGQIYGPGRDLEGFVRRFAGQTMPSDGSNITNFSHVDDIARVILYAFEHHLEGVFNLCNETHTTRQEFYDRLCSKWGLPKVVWDPTRPSLHGGAKTVVSNKIQQAGFIFRHPQVEL